MSNIFVTNNGSAVFKDSFDGKQFSFEPGKPVEIPLLAAKHIFGYGDDNKSPYLVRLGWLRMSNEMDAAMARLNEFKFDSQHPTRNHSISPVVDKVASLPPKGGRGAKVQAA